MRALDSLVATEPAPPTNKVEARRLSKGAGSRKLRFEVLARDNFTCRYCGAKPPEASLEVDHCESVANGGKDELANYVTSCTSCNKGKGKASASPPAAGASPSEFDDRVTQLLADLRVPRNSATESLAQMYFEVRAAVAAMAKRLKDTTTTDRQLAAALGSATGKTLQTIDMIVRVGGPIRDNPGPTSPAGTTPAPVAPVAEKPALRPELQKAADDFDSPIAGGT